MNILIDDQKTFHSLFKLLMKVIDLGEWRMFSTSDEALAFIDASDGHDITVLMGWHNPGSALQKSDLIGELKLKPGMKIFIVSSSTNHEDISEARVAGARGWICKADLHTNLAAWKDERQGITKFTEWL